jgi:hypothetical protein
VSGEETARREADGGWQRCFCADEPRLSEAVQTYEELGFEVQLRPAMPEEIPCTACRDAAGDRFRVIYVRPAPP